jgi:hypothetical protein
MAQKKHTGWERKRLRRIQDKILATAGKQQAKAGKKA